MAGGVNCPVHGALSRRPGRACRPLRRGRPGRSTNLSLDPRCLLSPCHVDRAASSPRRKRPILPIGYNVSMTKSEIGLILANARRRSGKTQSELAQAMGTTQPAIARAEAGYRMPTLGFIDRWARATGAPISLKLGQTRPEMQPASARRAMVRSVLGAGRFNPWDRNPAPIEAALLEKAGLS